MTGRLSASILIAAALTCPALAAETGFAPVEIRARAITQFAKNSDAVQFGDLTFRGGLELVSLNQNFGSLSGIAFLPDSTTFVAVADTGYWFSARAVESDGRLTGIADTRIAPMLMDDGKPPANKIEGDAEGVRIATREGVPTAYVSFEQTTAIRAYAGPDFASATPTRLKLPPFVRGIRRNLGLEAIAVAPADGTLGGAIVTIAERSLDEAGNHRAFVLSGPRAGAFAIRRSDDLDITDAAFLPDGDLLILERRFSFSGGLVVRVRRIAGDDIRPGATVRASTVMESDSANQIDNLEGLAVRVVNGETLVMLVSDNNGSMFQRTLLLEFALQGSVMPASAAPLPHLRPADQK